ncbi:6-phosphogluconolactonase [Flavimobilis soli]|uniref:6-phosphogluconolactonase n=1 Tax=Flavimobilis soli TaxID=442709 RepID=A0A2A9EA68_9MICO|nr:6-phosphogluconolactonase [Flavimobilis soli]PFG35703.1 6-phosphogluconolactonase [Flavimobilis soli]
MSARRVVVHPDAEVLAQATASRLLTRLLDLQSVRTPVHVVLTGGTVGIKVLADVAAHPVRDAVDWGAVHLWWGDDRFVPEGHADRNVQQARDALLDHLPTLPAGNVHAMPAARPEDPAFTEDDAARDYAAELARFAEPGDAAPQFDVLMLGMGPDHHVASLFPGHPALEVSGVATTGVADSPKPPPLRVSLTFDAIRRAREVWIVAAGAEKAAGVRAGLSGAPVVESPVAGAVGQDLTLWLVDAAAAGEAAEAVEGGA